MLEAEEEKRRFQIELEFIQCLSNPWYLNSKVLLMHLIQGMVDWEIWIDLAQQQYFKDEAFINYLEYLQYWKQPEYAKFVVYDIYLYSILSQAKILTHRWIDIHMRCTF